MPPIEIDTPRIVLRPFAPADAAEAFGAITSTLTRFMAWEPPASPRRSPPSGRLG